MAMLSDGYAIAVCKALGVDSNKVRRVVIDATANEPLRVYLDFYANLDPLQVKLPSGDIEIVTSGKTHIENPEEHSSSQQHPQSPA